MDTHAENNLFTEGNCKGSSRLVELKVLQVLDRLAPID